MRCSVLIPVAAVVASATASIILPKAASASNEIFRRQTTVTGSCAALCNPVETTVTNCGVNLTCLCAKTVASALQACAQCGVQQNPSLASQLQTSLNQYSGACNQGGQPVGSLTVGAGGAAASTTSAAVVTPVVSTTPVVITTPAAATSATPAAATSAAPIASSAVLSALPSVTATPSGAGQIKVAGAGVLASVLAVVVALF